MCGTTSSPSFNSFTSVLLHRDNHIKIESVIWFPEAQNEEETEQTRPGKAPVEPRQLWKTKTCNCKHSHVSGRTTCKNLFLQRRGMGGGNQSPLDVCSLFLNALYHCHSCLCLEISDSLERQVRKAPEFGDNTFRFSWIEISSSQQAVITVKHVRKYI